MFTSTRRLAALAALFVPAALASAQCDPEQTWAFDLTTDGADVSFTSPTSVATDAPRYLLGSSISLVETTVLFGIFEFTVDVTDQIPPEILAGGSVILDGPLPVSVPPLSVVYPPAPEPPGVSATIALELDANGFGQLSVTDVVLGDVTIEIPIFGLQTVTILDIRVVGTATAQAIGPASDVTGDCVVDFDDLLAVLSAWGSCVGCAEDVDLDGVVGFSDLLQVLADWD